MKKAIVLFFCFAALIQCQTKKSKLAGKQESYQLIDVSEIFDQELAESAAEAADDIHKTEAAKHFLAGLDLYRNKKQPQTALGHFRTALAIYPHAKAYYELGNALMDLRVYDEALQAYEMSNIFGYTPAFNPLYNMACANACLFNRDMALDNLEAALEEGYSNKENLLKDKDLDNIRNEKWFSSLLVKYFKDSHDQRKVLFELFLENFKSGSLPYTLDAEDVNEFDMDRGITYDYANFIESMENSRFARNVEYSYMYADVIAKTDSFIILSYKSNDAMADTLGGNITYIATYTPGGKLLDTKLLGGNISGTEYITGSVDQNFIIKTESYARVWKENPLEKGFSDNVVLSSKLIKREFFHVDPKGKIEVGDVAIGPQPE